MFFGSKQVAESKFWRDEISNYEKWYRGGMALYGDKRIPLDDSNYENVSRSILRCKSVESWFEAHQKPKYLKDLLLDKGAFVGCKVLDIGCGPFLSALAFEDCKVFGLDPLIADYVRSGFPLHIYEDRGSFVSGVSEEIPLPDSSVDAVISVNAIDHVDDFEITASEIKRILVPNGRLRMHVHYHRPYKAEPIEINDERFIAAFGWAGNLSKIYEGREKTGYSLSNPDEKFVVWSNF